MQKPNEPRDRRNSSRAWILGAVLGGVLLLVWGVWPRKGDASATVTFEVAQGPLDITIVEGGSVQAEESQEIKCEVRVGYQGVKILKIVEEGYQVTEEDVRTNKLLVELDSSEIQKQVVQQEIQYQSAAASRAEAHQGYEIQVNQNLSDNKAAEQKARFARLDFDKFLGAEASERMLASLGLSDIIEVLAASAEAATVPPSAVSVPRPAPAETGEGLTIALTAGSPLEAGPNVVTAIEAVQGAGMMAGSPAEFPAGSNGGAAGMPSREPSLPPALLQKIDLDFHQYADPELLGDGEAKQKLRKFQDDLMVARRELEQSRSTREGTKRLFDRGFVTRIDMERDDIALTNAMLKVDTALTAQELFIKYEFPKLAEESLSKYLEAVRELDRARKAAISKLAQAEARLKSAQAQFAVQERQRQELQEQLGKCRIYAERPGLVVYGGGEDMYWGNQEQVREGATVRERQTIITIPDMTKMSVKVKIHESYIKKVKKGQRARVTVDAFPDQPLVGEVTYVGVLPDSQNRWMNPDMKVYRTTVTIDGIHDWLKPGMSAKSEILVDHLEDVVYVPIQAVVPVEGKQICYLANGGNPAAREVEVGQFNDSFIEVRKGLQKGERVLLKPPGSDRAGEEKEPNGPAEMEAAPEPVQGVASPA